MLSISSLLPFISHQWKLQSGTLTPMCDESRNSEGNVAFFICQLKKIARQARLLNKFHFRIKYYICTPIILLNNMQHSDRICGNVKPNVIEAWWYWRMMILGILKALSVNHFHAIYQIWIEEEFDTSRSLDYYFFFF